MNLVQRVKKKAGTLAGIILLPIQMVVSIVLVVLIMFFQGIIWENENKKENE